MESDETTIWNLRNGVRLIWRRLDNDYVVFNEGSGETHLPSALAEWVLREIEASPATLGSLVKNLARDAEIDQSIALSSVRDVLTNCNEVGLVAPGRKSIENR